MSPSNAPESPTLQWVAVVAAGVEYLMAAEQADLSERLKDAVDAATRSRLTARRSYVRQWRRRQKELLEKMANPPGLPI